MAIILRIFLGNFKKSNATKYKVNYKRYIQHKYKPFKFWAENKSAQLKSINQVGYLHQLATDWRVSANVADKTSGRNITEVVFFYIKLLDAELNTTYN